MTKTPLALLRIAIAGRVFLILLLGNPGLAEREPRHS
jgi:hypothetical protein